MPQPPNPSDRRVRAAVIGLGQAGSRFDEEPGRKAIWSHVGAYLERSDRVALVGAVEIASPNAAAFRARCPDIPMYADVETLITEQRPHIVSICTPPSDHAETLFKLLDAPDLRLIWCEKPLAAGLADARRMVEACQERNIKLMASYNRHWLPIWRRTYDLIRDGVLGPIRTLRVAFPNRLFSIGSHAVDLALMLGGPVASVVAQPLPELEERGEPAIVSLLHHCSGVSGIVQVTGTSKQFFAEAEIIGDDGRLFAREDKGLIVLECFEESRIYKGYRQLGVAREERTESANFSTFLAMADNAIDAVTRSAPLACDGAHALEVQRVLDLIVATAR